MTRPAIAVVGAGLIGATAALCLSQRCPRHQIHWLDRHTIEPPPPPADFDSRVIACTPGSRNFLDRLGVWSRVNPDRVQAYERMQVWDHQGDAGIVFRAEDLGSSSLGCIVEVGELLRALYSRVAEQENIRPWSGTAVEGLGELQSKSRPLILSSGEALDCELIVGADGSGSPLRELARIKTRVRPMGQRALVAVVTHEKSHQSSAWQSFGKNGPLAFLPLPDGARGEHQSAIVWSLDVTVAEHHEKLPDKDLADLLASAMDFRLGQVLDVSRRAAFPLSQLHAADYVRPGLCLVGDAIHTIHPLAGQGANLGLRDVAALDGELERALRRNLWLGDPSVLRRFERSRKLENLMMLGGMEAFRYGFGSELAPVRWARNLGMRQLNKWSSLKNFIARQAML